MLRRLVTITAFKIALFIGLVFAITHFIWRAQNPKVVPFTLVSAWDDAALDAKFRLRGPQPSSGKVTIAGVDEKSLERYGLWPWKRDLVGQALKNLNDAGAKAIGVDVWFPNPDRNSAHLTVNKVIEEALQRMPVVEGGPAEQLRETRGALEAFRLADPDQLLAEALKLCPKVVLGAAGFLTEEDLRGISAQTLESNARALERFTSSTVYAYGDTDPETGQPINGWQALFKTKPSQLTHLRTLRGIELSLPVLNAATHQIGLIDTDQDHDGKIRKYPLLSRLGDRVVPSLAVATAAVALEARPVALLSQSRPESIDYVGLLPLDGSSLTGINVPVEPDGARFLINYPGSFKAELDGKPLYERISLADAVDNTFDLAKVKDRIVLVGTTAPGTFDQRVTPFDKMVPGVYTHAAVIDNVLTGNFLVQSAGIALVEVLLLLLVAIAFGLVIPRFEAYYLQLAFMFAMVGAYLVADFALFQQGIVLSSVVPLMEMAVLFGAMLVFKLVVTDREKRQIRTTFQHYLAPSVLEDMVKNPDKLRLGGEKRELTVFFSDIRGFTTISERLPAEELSRLLNEYLTPMSNLVFKHQGTLDKYMGDAVMAFWGAPLEQPDHALRACTAAVEMLKTLDTLRAQWKAQGRPDIQIGIGLNSGPMSVGNMGSNMFFNYTVMGDAVNLGSRLEGTNKAYGTNIIMSEFTFAKVKGQVAARELGSVRVKGKKLPVGIYELRGIGQPAAAEAGVIADFEAGIAAYRARKWDEAEGSFRKVLEAWKEDGPSAHYLEDIEDKRAHPPSESWDGVYEMKTK